MKTLFITALLFLAGCSIFPQKQIQTAAEMAKLSPKEQTTIYITKTLSQTDWLTTVCIVGGLVGFFAFLGGQGWGLRLAATGAMGICVILMIASAAAWIAVATKWLVILAACAAAVAAGLLLYAIFVKGRALKEIVAGVEKIRKTADEQLSDSELLGCEAENPILSGITEALSKQSPSTKSIVSSIKESLPAKGQEK
jgi:hypothetical protein